MPQYLQSARVTIVMSSQLDRLAAEANDSLQKDNALYATQMIRWFLRPLGIRPVHPDTSAVEKISSVIQIVICYSLLCFLLIPCGFHTFLEEDDPDIRLKLIGPLSFCLMAISEYCFLVIRRSEIFTCIEHIAEDWSSVKSTKDQEIMLADAKFGRVITSFCAAFMYGGGFFYDTIMPFSFAKIVTEQNITVRPLVYPVYEAFWDTARSPDHEMFYVTQWFSGVVMYTITGGVCSVAAVCSSHACGQFKILIERLDKLVDGDDQPDTVEERIAQIIELHLRTLGFIARVRDVLNEVCLIEFVGSTFNICFLGYYLITEWERSDVVSSVTYCVLLISFTFNIFIFCFIGEILTEESMRVGTVAYMIEWHRLRGTEARGLILVLLMSKNPSSISAGKMVDLSMASFGGVLRTSMAYLNMLRQVTS